MIIYNITDLIGFIIVLILFAIVCLITIIKNWLDNKNLIKKRKTNREIAIRIIDEFENVLSENNIKIPNLDREGNEDEASIYGSVYYDLEDSIIDILNNK